MTETAQPYFWITGAYLPLVENRVKGNEWVSFAYGPFPDEETTEKVVNSNKKMIEAIGSVTDYEIDCANPLEYGQACKHFEDTIMSDYFKELLDQ